MEVAPGKVAMSDGGLPSVSQMLAKEPVTAFKVKDKHQRPSL